MTLYYNKKTSQIIQLGFRRYNLLYKYKGNPIIKPEDVEPSLEGYKVLGAFNPGATRFKDEILLLLRVAEGCEPKAGFIRTPVYRFDKEQSYPDIMEFEKDDLDVSLKDTRGVVYKGQDYLSTISHIRLARSKDGIHFTVDGKPFIYSMNQAEKYGVEDARVTYIEDKYYINYTAVSSDSWATALAVTDDFVSVIRKGLIFYPENKDVAIFPEKVGGKFIALHRPNNSGFGKASIWYSESPDLIHWGNHKCIIRPRKNPYESIKIGGGAPPIKTKVGWLVIYHAKGEGGYSLFSLLLDLEKPYKIIKRANTPLITPTEDFEVNGFLGRVIFTNGMVEIDHKIYIYYGASDESVGLVITDVKSLLASLDL